MYASDLNELTTKYRVDSGHGMCHPETCCCWNYQVYKTGTYQNVLNADSSECVKKFLSENDPTYKGK